MTRPRRHDEDGALAAEFVGILPILLVVAAVGWQLLLIVGAGTSAATAARNGSRSLSTGENVEQVIARSLPGWLDDFDHEVRGSRVDVHVRVPVLFPGVTSDAFRLTRSAELPRTN